MHRVFALCLLSVILVTSSVRAENYAVIIGIGGYDEKQLKPLGEYPRNDAIEFRDLLVQSGFKIENIVLMVDDMAALPKTTPAGRYLPEASKIRGCIRGGKSQVVGIAGFRFGATLRQ